MIVTVTFWLAQALGGVWKAAKLVDVGLQPPEVWKPANQVAYAVLMAVWLAQAVMDAGAGQLTLKAGCAATVKVDEQEVVLQSSVAV